MLPLLTVTVANIISVPLFYRFLGTEMYALWLYVLTFTGAFGFMDLGIGVAVGRYIGVALGKNDVHAVREYWGTGNAIVIPLLGVMLLVFSALGVFCGPKWFNVSQDHVRLLQWCFIGGGINLFLSYYGQYWLILSQVHLDFKFLGILRTSVSLLQVLPSIGLAWLTRNPLVLIIWSAAIATVQLAVYVWHARKAYNLGFDFRHAGGVRAREMAVYTGKTFATLLVGSLFGSIDRLVFGKLAPAADFTNYAISSNAGGRIQGLSQAVMGPVFSNSSRSYGGGSREALATVYNETFAFTFPWYLLFAIWVAVWHPALLHLWLGKGVGAAVATLFTPVIIACCLTAVSSISGAQLGPLNRLGAGLWFTIGTGLLTIAGVYIGWELNGAVGVAWGFLCSRIGVVAQDLFVIRLIKAGGWLAASTWKSVAQQCAVALAFCGVFIFLPRNSLWTLIPSVIHGLVVAAWLLEQPIRKRLGWLVTTPNPA